MTSSGPSPRKIQRLEEGPATVEIHIKTENVHDNISISKIRAEVMVDKEEGDCRHFLKKLEVEEFENVENGFRVKFVFDDNPLFERDVAAEPDGHVDDGGATNETPPPILTTPRKRTSGRKAPQTKFFQVDQNSYSTKKSSKKRINMNSPIREGMSSQVSVSPINESPAIIPERSESLSPSPCVPEPTNQDVLNAVLNANQELRNGFKTLELLLTEIRDKLNSS